MEYLSRKGIPGDCRGGGCGFGKIRISKQRVRALKSSRQQVTRNEEAGRSVLACPVFLRSDVKLGVQAKMAENFNLQRFVARPLAGRVESSAAVLSDRSLTIREEN